jgi:hypothetical protein
MRNLSNETELLESKELRNEFINRTEILEKVKSLLLIPQTDIATIHQVSEYFETDVETIQKVYQRNKEELDEDGVYVKSNKEFLNGLNVQLETSKGKSIISYDDGIKIEIPNRGLKVFPRRAILRIGMLLRDSIIAKEIRTQILNIEEKTSNEIKLQDITEEQKLMLEVGMAFASGNATALMIATTNMMAFKNRHITKLELSNKALANGILEWEDRSRINFAVRKLSQTAHIQYGQLWNELYKQLKNKYHIDLKARGKQPWIQYVEKREWNCVIKSFSALCKYYEQEPSDMFCDLIVSEGSANA